MFALKLLKTKPISPIPCHYFLACFHGFTQPMAQSGGNLRFSPKKPPLLLFFLFEKNPTVSSFTRQRGKPGKKDVFFFRTVSEPFCFSPFPNFFWGEGVKGLAPSDSQASWHVNFMRKERTERLPSIVEARVWDLWRMGSQVRDGDGYVVRIRAPHLWLP